MCIQSYFTTMNHFYNFRLKKKLKRRNGRTWLFQWGGVLLTSFMTPLGQTGRARSVKRGGAHLQYIYIIDSKRFQVDRLKTLGQVHYTTFCVRRTDGRTDVRTDAGRTDGRTDTTSNSEFSIIPKVVLIPIDTISCENRKCTHGQGKTYMAL